MKKKVKSGMTGGQKLVIVLVVLVLVLGMIAGTLVWLYRPPVDPVLPLL